MLRLAAYPRSSGWRLGAGGPDRVLERLAAGWLGAGGWGLAVPPVGSSVRLAVRLAVLTVCGVGVRGLGGGVWGF